jgi:kumamolisin
VSPHARYVTLPGSDKEPLAGARPIGPLPPDELVQVTVLLRPRAIPAVAPSPLTHREYEELYGARPEDVAAVEAFAARHGLDVSNPSLARRTVTLTGPASAFGLAFEVELAQSITGDGVAYRARAGAISVPAPLERIVEGVFGLDDRPQALPHFRLGGQLSRRAGAPAGFLPPEVAALYRFPTDVDGSGQTVAIVELGGGYRRRDLDLYFGELGIGVPSVEAVAVDGARNAPTGDAGGPDGEVMLDIEIVGAVAPGARIAVYFAPNSSRGFLDAVLAAVHDERRRPSALSISWGAAEIDWTRQSLRAMDDAFRAAAVLGVTVSAASGASGSSDGVGDGGAHVDSRASGPFVVACGGTRLERSAAGRRSERAWGGSGTNGATGGGVSEVFPRPDWQASARVPRSPNEGEFEGRGVPDVAANADPATGYRIRVDGSEGLFGGTSAVAPLLAGLVALINQRLGGRVGYLNPALYGIGAAAIFQDSTRGSNGVFAAARGWDACTGLGSPNGDALAEALAPPAP